MTFPTCYSEKQAVTVGARKDRRFFMLMNLMYVGGRMEGDGERLSVSN